MERKRQAMDDSEMGRPPTAPPVIVNAPSSRGGDTISSNSSNAIVAPMAASHDPTLGFGAAAP